MSRLTLALAVTASGVIGGAIGYLVAGARVSSLAAVAFTSSYSRAASDLALDVRTLRAIRANDIPTATGILEGSVDQSLVHLSDYNEFVPPGLRQTHVYRALAYARTYRAEVPSSNDGPEVQAAIKRALELGREGSEAR